MSTLPPITWTDGRRFAKRVKVWHTSGNYLFRTHADEAHRLLSLGSAIADDAETGKISRIMIIREPGRVTASGKDLSPGSYGTRYTFKENLGDTAIIHTLKNISNKDAWAFRLSRTDTLVDSFPEHKHITQLLKEKGKL